MPPIDFRRPAHLDAKKQWYAGSMRPLVFRPRVCIIHSVFGTYELAFECWIRCVLVIRFKKFRKGVIQHELFCA